MPRSTTPPLRAELAELLRWFRRHADAAGRIPVATAFAHADAELFDQIAADGYLRQDGSDLVLTSPATTAKEDAAMRALRDIWSERPLSATARAVASVLVTAAVAGDTTPTVRQIAAAACVCRTTAKAALAELEAAGILTRAPRATGSGSQTTVYAIPALETR